MRMQSFMMCGTLLLAAACQTTVTGPELDAADATPPKRIVTQGLATKMIAETLFKCQNPNPKMNYRASPVWEITATDGTVITVPGATALQKGKVPPNADLYNECTLVLPKNSAEVSTANVPVIEIDPDGEVITGYITGDNYWEMYVNGKLVSVDPIPYTPFNSSIVKFKVKRPYTIAIMGVDWEERMGTGMEEFPMPRSPKTQDWYLGDGGIVAKFSDGTVTDSTWKAQSFYIGPLADPKQVVERGHVHDTPHSPGRAHPTVPNPNCREKCYAVHYPIPPNWMSPRFNDRYWPRAWEFTDKEIGVTNYPAYTRYPELFEGARWIWSQNLVLDNIVIVRKTVR
ncbi:MAG: hypothetical protein ACT4P8_05915 [Betaproteobacteria bacterium]